MVFGDFIVTSEFVCVFLVDTKTYLYKQGQWATFAVSDRTSSAAYQLMQRLLLVLMSHSSQEIRDNTSSMIFVLFISTHLVTTRPEPICQSNSRISGKV